MPKPFQSLNLYYRA